MQAVLDNALQNNVLNLRYHNLHDNDLMEFLDTIPCFSGIEKIDIRDNCISDDGILCLLSKIEGASSLREFFAGYNAIGDKKAQDIFGFLSSFHEMENIVLNDSELSDISIMQFTNKFQNHTKLKHLDVSSNKISAEGAEFLGDFLTLNSSLSSLYMSYNKIGAKGAERLFKGMTNNSTLKKIYLRNNAVEDLGTESIAKCLTGNKGLESINLGDNFISDEGIEKFCQLQENNQHITSLNFGRNDISEKGALAIANFISLNNKLEHLNIGKNSIKNKGAEYLVEALRSNTSLKIFNVRDNGISETGARAIGSMLKDNKGVSILNICDNNIGDEGVKFIADGLRCNQNVQFLYITNNNYTTAGVNTLAQLQRDLPLNIVHFFDSQKYYDSPRTLKDYLATPSTKINILNESIAQQDFGKLFKDSSNITTISIQGSKIDEKTMSCIVDSLPKTLLALNLNNNAIDENGAKILSSWLLKCQNLEILELKNNKLGRKGAKYIAQALEDKKLKFVDLSYNYVGFEFIEEISNYHKLDRLAWTF